MGWCPHCNHGYDEDNESQPCCWSCGHPISCGCDCSDHPGDHFELLANQALDDLDSHPLYRSSEVDEFDYYDDPYNDDDGQGWCPSMVRNKGYWEARKTELASAIHRGNLNDVKRILRLGVYPTVKIGNKEHSPLLLAANFGQVAIAQHLIKSGAAVDQTNREGYTPLWMAAMSSDQIMCGLLIASGASMAHKWRGRTLLEELVMRDDRALLQWFLAAGSKTDTSASSSMVRESIARGNLEMLELLTEDVIVSLTAAERFDVLCEAVASPKCRDVAKLLIPKLLSTNELNKIGQTPLMCCVEDPERCRRALALGIPVNTLDSKGYSALSFAAQAGKVESVGILLDAGANPDGAGSQAPSPHEIAVYKGHASVAELLKKRGARRLGVGRPNIQPKPASYGLLDLVFDLLLGPRRR